MSKKASVNRGTTFDGEGFKKLYRNFWLFWLLQQLFLSSLNNHLFGQAVSDNYWEINETFNA